MSQAFDKISFWSIFCVIVALPIFFFPYTTIPFETAKGFLVVLGLVISIIFWTIARFTEGRITIPKSLLIFSGILMMIAFFLSSWHSGVREVSMFGALFDFGSFYFMLAAFLLMTMCALVVRDLKSAKIILLGLILSSTILFLFQVLHIFWPTALSLGGLFNKTDNLMGTWNSFGIFATFFSILSLYIIEFFKIPKGAKIILGVFMALALFVVLIVNLYIAWGLLELFALILFVYKISFSYHRDKTQPVKSYFPFLSFSIFIFAMVFFLSPLPFSSYVGRSLGVSNLDASTTLSSNFGVAKEVLKDHKLYGVGLNRFGEAWALYKPVNVNYGAFWNNYFSFGRGVIPTLAATTGYIGILAMLLFFLTFIFSGLRTVLLSARDGLSWGPATFFLIALFLFTASSLFAVDMVLFVLAMCFSGIFVGVTKGGSDATQYSIIFSNKPLKSFFFLFILMAVLFTSAFAGFKYLQRFASVPSFRTAVLQTNNFDISIPAIEKALTLHANDLYYRTAADVYLSKFVSFLSKGGKLSEEDNVVMQGALEQAIKYAMAAVEFNPKNYLNFETLGNIYLTAGQMGVDGSLSQAVLAYTEESKLNPLNPGIKLAIARASYLDSKKGDAAKFAEEAVELKPNYVDALIVLSQIKRDAGDRKSALTLAETALAYVNNTLVEYPEDTAILELKNNIMQYIESINSGSSNNSTDLKTETENN